jgi:ABC-2 type transport system permease protein
VKQFNNALYFAGKDLKLFIRDRIALFFFVLFPLLFMTMFSMMGPQEAEDPVLKLNLATQESAGGQSHVIIDYLKTIGTWEITEMDYDEARQKVEDKEINGFLAFPADFTEGIMSGSGTNIEVVADSDAIEERAALYGIANILSSQIGSHYITASAAIELLIENGTINPTDTSAIEEIIQQIYMSQGDSTAVESAVEFITEKVGDVEAENAANWALTGYLVMFVFFAAALSAEAIVKERQNNTLERLLSSSVKREAILGGMFAGSAAKGLIQIIIFWTVGLLLFKVDLGISPLATIILSILMVIMSSAFGIMLATLARTQRSAGSIAVLTSLILAPLGGCWWPLFILPKWMQALAKITPHGWANTGFNKLMLFGADFSAVIPEMLILVGFAVFFGIIAVWRFRTDVV